MKKNIYRKAGRLPWKKISRSDAARMFWEYRKDYRPAIRKYPDGTKSYQFDDKEPTKFPTNPYTFATSYN